MGNQTIENTLDELMDERIHQIAYRKCINDTDFVAANTEVVTLMEMLRSTLVTAEQKKILNELESALYITEAIFLEYSYRQGVQDSQSFQKSFESYGIVPRENLYV